MGSLGTQAPNVYPADFGPRTDTGARYFGMEARAGKVLNHLLFVHSDTFTIVATAPSVGDVAFEADATHTIAIGHVVELRELDVVFHAIVTGVVGDTITVDRPIPYAFTVAGATGVNGVYDAAVDGSTPVVYEIAPPANQIWDITKLMFYIEGTTTPMTHSLFGNITALTNGVTLRVKRSASKYEVIANFKDNAEFSLNSFETVVSGDMTAASFGQYSSKVFGNESESGSMIRLDGNLSESLQVVVRDNISTLTNFYVLVSGYFLKES